MVGMPLLQKSAAQGWLSSMPSKQGKTTRPTNCTLYLVCLNEQTNQPDKSKLVNFHLKTEAWHVMSLLHIYPWLRFMLLDFNFIHQDCWIMHTELLLWRIPWGEGSCADVIVVSQEFSWLQFFRGNHVLIVSLFLKTELLDLLLPVLYRDVCK